MVWDFDISEGRACTTNGQGMYTCPNNMVCGNIEDYPDIPTESEHFEQRAYINYGVTNFDNLGGSLLTVFQMITSETWYYQIMNLMDIDFPLIGAVYTFAIIIIGQFFLLNLILAVIIGSFTRSS